MKEYEKSKGRSEEWRLSLTLAKQSKRRLIALIVVVIMWLTTIAGFFVYDRNNVKGDIQYDGFKNTDSKSRMR